MNKIILSVLFLSIAQILIAQKQQKISVYFETDQHELKLKDQEKLAAFFEYFETKEVLKIELYGNTDSRESEAYNLELSKRRIAAVRQYLLTKNKIDSILISTYPKGEKNPIANNQNPVGRQQNRRTEVWVTYQEKEIVKNIPLPVEEPIIVAIPVEDTVDCSKDTTIIMPNGTKVVLGVCDYMDIKDCFSLVEYTTPQAARVAGLTAMTSNGRPLISAGMFKVDLCGRDDIAVDVLVPIPLGRGGCQAEVRPMTIWTQRKNGSWADTREKAEVITIRNQPRYYRATIRNSGMLNLDYLPPVPPVPKPPFYTRVKVPRGMKLLDATISFDAPFMIYNQNAALLASNNSKEKDKPIQLKRKIKFKMDRNFCPTCGEMYIAAKAINKDGDTLSFDYAIAELYHKRTAFGICKGERVKRFLGIFPIRQKAVYRKYILKPEDFARNMAAQQDAITKR